MTRVISRAELSRWAGVSRAAVTKASKGLLRDATTPAGIDVNHGIVREWLTTHELYEYPPEIKPAAAPATKKLAKKTKKRPAVRKKPKKKSARKPSPVTKKKPPAKKKAAAKKKSAPRKPPAKKQETSTLGITHIGSVPIERLEHLTIKEVVMRFGSVDGFKRYVDALKNIADYHFREIRTRQHRGELVEREKVAGMVFPLIDVAFSRLVNDVPVALGKEVQAIAESGGTGAPVEIERAIRDANSRVLKNLKQSIASTGVVV